MLLLYKCVSSRNCSPAHLHIHSPTLPFAQHTIPLPLRRHHCLRQHPRIFFPPQTRHRLHLRIEVQARLAIEQARPSARDTPFIPAEGEHWERHLRIS